MTYCSKAIVFVALACTACTTVIESNPPRTATEEMLISTAADRAADKLVLQMPKGTTAFIDSSNFEGTDSKYALSAIRTSLLKQGVRIVDAKKDAKIVVEVRSGALSTDRESTLVGIPQFSVPVPFASSAATIPQIAFYSSEKQNGVAKFAMRSYDTQTGTLVDVVDPQYGFAHKIKKTLLIFISWNTTDALPKGEDDALTPDVNNTTEAQPQPSVENQP